MGARRVCRCLQTTWGFPPLSQGELWQISLGDTRLVLCSFPSALGMRQLLQQPQSPIVPSLSPAPDLVTLWGPLSPEAPLSSTSAISLFSG